MPFCVNCGIELGEKTKFCPNCGKQAVGSSVNETQTQNFSTKNSYESMSNTENRETNSRSDISEKDWLTTLLLAIFLGCLGIHRFYVGKIGTGILMLLFGWATLGIWLLIDLIIIVTGNFRDKEDKLIKF